MSNLFHKIALTVKGQQTENQQIKSASLLDIKTITTNLGSFFEKALGGVVAALSYLAGKITSGWTHIHDFGLNILKNLTPPEKPLLEDIELTEFSKFVGQ